MLTTGEVAKLFHVSAQTVINWLDQGRLPYERIGKGPRRLTEQAVLSYIHDIGISTEALDGEIYEGLLKKSASEVAFDPMYGSGQNILPALIPGINVIHRKHDYSFANTSPEPLEKNLTEFSKYISKNK